MTDSARTKGPASPRGARDSQEPPANPEGTGAETLLPAEVKRVSTGLIRGRGSLYVLLGGSFLFLAWASLQISGFDDAPVTDTFAVSTCAALWLVLYALCSWGAFGTPYLLTSAYILAMMAFNFGLMAQDGFGILHVGSYQGDFGNWATLAGWYANLALGCLGVGFAGGGLAFRSASVLTEKEAAALARRNLARLRNLGIGLCFACLVSLGLAIMQLGNFLSLDRMQLFFSGDTRGIALINWFGPSAATAMVISAQSPREKRWSYLLGAVALVIFMLSGNRSMALFPLLVGIVIWVKTGHRFPLPIAAGVALAALLVIPVIGALRTIGAYDKVSLDSISSSSEGASVSMALAELGGSAGALAITLQYIPAEEPFRYGITYLRYLRQVVPNVGAKFDMAESPQATIAESGSLTAALPRLSPSRWASVRALGVQAAIYSNQGVGFSGIAEPYMNFGLAGVVAFFVGLGVFFVRMESRNLLLNFRWLVFATFFYWFLISTVRNEFGVFVKPAAFILISLGIWLLIRRFTPFARS